MSDKYNILDIKIQDESIIRKKENNNFNLTISDESVKRAEGDSRNRIQIAEESATRAEEDSKLSVRISNEIAKRVHEDSKLKIQIDKLEVKVNQIEKGTYVPNVEDILDKEESSEQKENVDNKEKSSEQKENVDNKENSEHNKPEIRIIDVSVKNNIITLQFQSKNGKHIHYILDNGIEKLVESGNIIKIETTYGTHVVNLILTDDDHNILATDTKKIEVIKQSDIERENFYITIEDEKNINFIHNQLSQLDGVKLNRLISENNLKYLNTIKKEEDGYEPACELIKFFKIKFDNKEQKNQIEALLKKQNIKYFIESIPKDSSKELPAVDPSDEGPLYATQEYLGPAPGGIDAHCIWDNFPNTIGNPGLKTGFIDLESGWVLNHEDLPLNESSIVFGNNRTGPGRAVHIDHGTAVVGEVAGLDNDRGVLGIAPGVGSIGASSHFIIESDGTASSLNVADAIIGAIVVMKPGDVLLLEVQRADASGSWDFPVPVESNMADFRAIQLATAKGIIVVEAAGNGSRNLNTLSHIGVSGINTFNRTSPDFLDSGAIMVAAINNTVPHTIASFSNFGNRIDSCSWGNWSVTTTGYGDAGGESMGPASYTSDFAGTSSASPIIVGAILLIQSYSKNYLGISLTPQQIRTILQDPNNGTPVFNSTAIGSSINTNAGRQPDLCTIINGFRTSDVYIRDNVFDNGQIPTTGGISASPDIIVRRNTVIDPISEFGEGSGTKFNNLLGYEVEAGQNNYIYTRKLNKGNLDANNVTTDVYWSEVSTLPTPNLWNFIGTSNPVNVPVGNTFAVADPIIWNKDDIPGKGHYCFIGITGNINDPKTLTSNDVTNFATFGLTWDGFKDLIRNNNNVTWRNFNVTDVIPNLEYKKNLDFIFNGSFDKTRKFNLIIEHNLEKLDWIVPSTLNDKTVKKLLVGLDESKVERMYYKGNMGFLYPNIPKKIQIQSLPMNVNEIHRSRFLLKELGNKLINKTITVIQLEDNIEVGRVTWTFIKARDKLSKDINSKEDLENKAIQEAKARAEQAKKEAIKKLYEEEKIKEEDEARKKQIELKAKLEEEAAKKAAKEEANRDAKRAAEEAATKEEDRLAAKKEAKETTIKKAAEAAQKAAKEIAMKKAVEELRRKAVEEAREAEKARIKAEKDEAAAKKAAEEAAARKAAEEAAARKAAEEAAVRKAAEEAAAIKAEEEAAARKAAEEAAARKAAEEAAAMKAAEKAAVKEIAIKAAEEREHISKILSGVLVVEPTLGYVYYTYVEGNNLSEGDIISVIIDDKLRAKSVIKKSGNRFLSTLNINISSEDEYNVKFYLTKLNTNQIIKSTNNIKINMPLGGNNIQSIGNIKFQNDVKLNSKKFNEMHDFLSEDKINYVHIN